MPEEDFELFLSLLSRLLRLDPEQKTAIADELRDHLEERLRDLHKQGVPRKDAVRQALDEFGDAAGLASQFTSLSHRRRRRKLMRYTLATGVLAGLVFLGVILFGPGDSDGPPQQLAAQDSEKAETQPEPATTKPAETIPTMAEVLLNPVDVEFIETPLEDVADFLGDQNKLTVFIDRQALKEEGIAIDEPVAFSADKTPLYLVLNRILKPKHLQWYYEKGLLFFTSRLAAEEIHVTRYYPMKSLLDAGYSESVIVDLVQNITEGPWIDIDGTGGELMFVGRMLAVRQSYPAHREIARLLAAMQKHNHWAEQLKNVKSEKERMKLWQRQTEEQLYRRLEPDSHAKLRDALQLPADVSFIDTPLSDTAEFLTSFTGVPVVLDEVALKEEGISDDEPINLTLKGQSVETTLNLMLDPLNGEAVLSDGTILITTQIVAEYEQLLTVIYNVRDIADDESTMSQLVDAVYVATEGPWLQSDGTGGLIEAPKPGTMIVRQHEEDHEEIVKLLENQRREPDTEIKLEPPPQHPVTKMYRMNAETAEDLLESLPELVAPESWQTKDSKGEGTIRKVAAGQKFVKPPESNSKDEKKDNDSAEKEADKPAQTEYIVIPEAVLVIRQTPDVHRKIEDFLRGLLTEGGTFSRRAFGTPLSGGGRGLF